MSERMLPFSGIDWAEVATSTESPIKLCLRKSVPVYIKVRRDGQVVYRHHLASIGLLEKLSFQLIDKFSLLGPAWRAGYVPADKFPFKGFCEELAFLALDDESLAEIDISRSCHVSSFSGWGFAIPRPYEITGYSRGGFANRRLLRIEVPTLTRVEFERAFIVDRVARDQAWARIARINAPPPEHFAIQIEVREDDLYVASADFEELKGGMRQNYELVDYPFDHANRMPGVYWMFQAAYALNDQHLIGENEVLEWLRAKCAGTVFRGKKGAFAAKLIPMKLDRAKGRKRGPMPLKIWDLKNWANNPELLTYPFVSDGLTLTLAVAEWWMERQEQDPNVSRVVLAKQVYEQNFDKMETDYVVRLIDGVGLSKDQELEFGKWANEKDKREKSKTL